MQYSGVNWSIFGAMRPELKYPLGRICECFPYAVIGLYLYKFRIIENWKKRWLCGCGAGLLFALLGAVSSRFVLASQGFYYNGIPKTLIATGIFLVAAIIPISKAPQWVLKWTDFISRYTMGIYCIHMIVGRTLKRAFPNVSFGLPFCILIYALCYMISFTISRIPNNWCKKMVA